MCLIVVVDVPHYWSLSPPPPLAIYLVGCFHPPQVSPTLTPLPACHVKSHKTYCSLFAYLHIVIIIACIGRQTGRGDILAEGNGLAQSDNGIVI